MFLGTSVSTYLELKRSYDKKNTAISVMGIVSLCMIIILTKELQSDSSNRNGCRNFRPSKAQ